MTNKMKGYLGVDQELALLAPESGRAMLASAAAVCGHLVVGVSPVLVSLDGFSSPGRAVKAERWCGQVSFISEQSVLAAFERLSGQASFT